MKKKLLILATIMSAILLLSLVGCKPAANIKDYVPKETNLAKDATYTSSKGKTKSTFSLSGSGENNITVNFGKTVTFNTVMLKATNNNIDLFEIYINGEMIYQQDEIGGIRTCWLNNQTTDKLTIKVLKARGSYKINFCGVYNMPRGNRDFRVTTYLEVGSSGERLDNFDAESLQHVDTVILFNAEAFGFTDLGALQINETVLEKSLKFVRDSNPNIKVLVNLLPNSSNSEINGLEWPLNIAKIHSDAFDKNSDKLVGEINALIAKYSLAGIGFDYEYPQSDADWKIYSDFVVKLKTALGDKILSLAIQFWGGQFTPEALKAVDQFEIMCYDFVDKDGAHSTFYSAISQTLANLKNCNFDMSKVNIGLPFYSRPTKVLKDWNLLRYWGDYKTDYEKLGKYTNYLKINETRENIEIDTLYYNSYQMIADKTSFCYDYGVGGVMIWNYGSDVPYSNPLSLHRAINEALGK